MRRVEKDGPLRIGLLGSGFMRTSTSRRSSASAMPR